MDDAVLVDALDAKAGWRQSLVSTGRKVRRLGPNCGHRRFTFLRRREAYLSIIRQFFDAALGSFLESAFCIGLQSPCDPAHEVNLIARVAWLAEEFLVTLL